MKTEDVIFSHLRTRYPELLATAIEGIEARRVRILPVALPTVRKLEADFAVRVLQPGPPHVLHAEHWSARGRLARTAFYHMWYHEATGLPVRTVIVTTTPRLSNAVPREYTFRAGRGRTTRVPLDVLHLWRVPARSVLDRGLVALYPFVPVMRDSRPARVLLTELRGRIIEDVSGEQDRGNLLAGAYLIATRRFGEDLLGSVFGGVGDMGKTDLGQKLIDQGKEIGKEIGERRGRIAAKRETLLEMMRKKFGDVPASVELKILEIEDPARLDRLLLRILSARSLAGMRL